MLTVNVLLTFYHIFFNMNYVPKYINFVAGITITAKKEIGKSLNYLRKGKGGIIRVR